MVKQQINIEEFELEQPFNYEEMLQNADNIFAELLIRHYHVQKHLTSVNDNCIIKVSSERKDNEQLPISKRGSGDSWLHKAGSSKENLEGVY